MKTIAKACVAFLLSACAIAGASASAEYRPDYCPVRHDHRSHDRNYYDYYPADNYYGERRRRRSRGQVVYRETFPTRFQARIVVIERAFYGRGGGRQLVCNVKVRGPEAGYVPRRRLRRIANNHCSPRAFVQYY